ncbi:TonB family protein [Candidatus Jorgensenbacteria bacterium]|nr:TonB family protein [Candidatus Jorgensenbacteria bacterium]
MTKTVDVRYGFSDIRKKYPSYLALGLVLATAFHFLFFMSAQFLNGAPELSPRSPITIIPYPPTDFIPPPTIPHVPIPSPPTGPAAKPSFAIPVPVPDNEVDINRTITPQDSLSKISGFVAKDGNGSGGVLEGGGEFKFEEEPSPEAFIPVEQSPVPIIQMTPEYPEIAKRAGIEGTVWVKILVGKDGKAKKAIVVKSDADVFDDPSIKAALKWVFTPAMMNNGPVEVWAAIPFRFKLNR